MTKPIELLIVEDNPGDVVLLREAIAKVGLEYRITVLRDGVEATDYLRGTGRHVGVARPDLVMLDLKLPRKSGREVLDDIALDPRMGPPLLVVLSSSRSELELARVGMLKGQVCMTKPGTFDDFVELVETIEKARQDVAGRGRGGEQ